MFSKYFISTKLNLRYRLILLFFTLVSGSIFYFSWIPDSSLKSESYLPHWIVDWSNLYVNLRTAVPFIGFGFLLEALLSFSTPTRKKRVKFYFWLRNSFIALAIVGLAEVGQFFILNRHPDVLDVLYGILGSQLGFLMYNILQKVINRFP